jgi:hypothetical protein
MTTTAQYSENTEEDIHCPCCEDENGNSGTGVKLPRYWPEKCAYLYVCLDCADFWIEKERVATCLTCSYPLYIDIRSQKIGYYCGHCNSFDTSGQCNIEL